MAVAVAVAGSSDLTPSWEPPYAICRKYGPKKQEKKNQQYFINWVKGDFKEQIDIDRYIQN